MTKLEIKAAKPIRGHDGQGFNATLYIDDVKACFVDDDGWGGDFTFTFLSKNADVNKALEAKLDEYVLEHWKKANPNKPPEKYMTAYRDMVIGELVEDFLQLKKLRARCKKSLCFVQPKHKKGAYVSQLITPDSLTYQRQRIAQEFPDVEFLNDHLEDGKWKALLKFGE